MVCGSDHTTYSTICSLNEESVRRGPISGLSPGLAMLYWGPCKEGIYNLINVNLKIYSKAFMSKKLTDTKFWIESKNFWVLWILRNFWDSRLFCGPYAGFTDLIAVLHYSSLRNRRRAGKKNRAWKFGKKNKRRVLNTHVLRNK